MRSALAVLAPAAKVLAKLVWIIAKAIIAFAVLFVFMGLFGWLMQELLEAVGLYQISYDLADGIRLGVSAAVIVVVACKLFSWVSGKKWFVAIGPKLATKSVAPSVARSPAESLWFFAKALMALLAWVACAILVGYWLLRLSEAMTLEGIVADTADGLLCAIWMVGTVMLGLSLVCWVNGETWREFWSSSPAYQKPDYTPDSEKN